MSGSVPVVPPSVPWVSVDPLVLDEEPLVVPLDPLPLVSVGPVPPDSPGEALPSLGPFVSVVPVAPFVSEGPPGAPVPGAPGVPAAPGVPGAPPGPFVSLGTPVPEALLESGVAGVAGAPFWFKGVVVVETTLVLPSSSVTLFSTVWLVAVPLES